MNKKYPSLVAATLLALSGGLAPVVVFADKPTGNESWNVASLEATTDGAVSSYKIINLTNKNWQDGLNIWWRATIPCGTFTGSGLTAIWDRAGCGAIDYAKTPVSVAIIIENTKVSGKEYPYPDHLGAPAKNPPEHLIVYAEYPEEGYKHGYGTSLLYYGYDAFLKYNPVREGTANTTPLPDLWPAADVEQQQEEQEATPASTQSGQEQSKGGGVPWAPIALGVAVLAGAGYWIRSRLIGGDYGEHTQNMDFGRDDVPDQYATKEELARRDREDAIEASDKVDRKNRDKFFEKVRQEQAEADRSNVRARLSDTAPADYQAPEGPPEDPDVM